MYTLSLGYEEDGEGGCVHYELYPQEVYERVVEFAGRHQETLLDDVEVKNEKTGSCLYITYVQELALVIIDSLAPVGDLERPARSIRDAFHEVVEVQGKHLLPREDAHRLVHHYLWNEAPHPGYQWEECQLDRWH